MHNPPMVYIQNDIPEGMTLSDWRATTRPAKRKRRRLI